MMFHGILKTKIFGQEHNQEYLEFLQGLTDRASLAPLLALRSLQPKLMALMRTHHTKDIPALLAGPGASDAHQLAEQYLANFGSRTPDELKLESPRFSERPAELLQLILRSSAPAKKPKPLKPIVTPLAHCSLPQRVLAKFAARHARRAIDWRERFRFNRAQVFDVARSAYLAMGEIFTQEQLLDTPHDIFWLTEEEIEQVVGGHAWDYELKDIVAKRKQSLTDYEKSPLTNRVESRGKIAPLHLSNTPKIASAAQLAGNGVAPGTLTAEPIIATEFDANLDVRGKILVVRHIDPGWTLLFTQAAGVITEKGNALSHAAIVARELGIPAIVAVPDALARLRGVKKVTMNGTTGEINATKK